MATPLLVVSMPGLSALSALERPFLAASALLCAAALAAGTRIHRHPGVWAVAGLGFLVWTASLAGWLAPVPETVATVSGSLVVAGGMLWNARLRHRAAREACPCPTC